LLKLDTYNRCYIKHMGYRVYEDYYDNGDVSSYTIYLDEQVINSVYNLQQALQVIDNHKSYTQRGIIQGV